MVKKPRKMWKPADAKRLIGRKFDDPAVQSDMKHWPFKVINADGGKPKVQVEYKGEVKTFTPEEISSMVLTKMKETAEAFLGHSVKVHLNLNSDRCGRQIGELLRFEISLRDKIN